MRRIAVSALAALATALGVPAAALPAVAAPEPATASYAVHAPAAAAPAATSPEHPLFSVSCPAAKLCVAVGQDARSGHAIAEKWNGTRWTVTALPLPRGDRFAVLSSISCPTTKRCIAVGEAAASTAFAASRLYAETWNGTSWVRLGGVLAPSGAHGVSASGVSCVSATSCAVVGVFAPKATSSLTVSFTEVLSGGKWKLFKPPGFITGNSVLENVSCTSASHCVAVGNAGRARTAPSGSPAAIVAAETWNGRNWSETRLPMPAGGRGAWLYDVSCASATSCVATGGQNTGGGLSFTFAERLSGTKWAITSTASGNGNDSTLFAVSCPAGTKFCMAAGGGEIPSVQDVAFADSWNGSDWLQWSVAAPVSGAFALPSMILGISCPTTTRCVGVGFAGPVQGNFFTSVAGFSSVWNGSNWHLVSVA